MTLSDKIYKPAPVDLEVLHVLNERKVILEQLHALWQPHDEQRKVLKAIFQDGKKTVFCRCGRRSGKTEGALYIALRRAALFPNQRILIVTPTLKQAKKVYWKSGKVVQMIPKEWNCHLTNDDLTIKFANGSYIEIDGSDDIESHRGAEYDVVIIDEFKDIKPMFYSEIINPTMATTDGILVIIGTPPKNKNNHYFELEASVVGDKDWGFFHWTSYDNPYVKKDWLIREEQKYIKRGEHDVWKREYLAEYCFGGKDQIFPMFNKRKHLKELDDIIAALKLDWNRLEWIISCDPATSSIFGVGFFAYDRGSNRLFHLDEIYASDKSVTSTGEIHKEIELRKKALNPDADWEYVYDEAAAWFANEMLSRFGISMFPSRKSANIKEEGIGLLKDLMLEPNGYTLASHCKSTVFEIESYIMENGKYPAGWCHMIDLTRYALGHLNLDFSYKVNDTTNDPRSSDYEPDFSQPKEDNYLSMKDVIH